MRYNRDIIYDSSIPVVRRLDAYDDSIMEDIVSIVDVTGSLRLRIDKTIRNYGVNTYQFVFSCKDEYNV